MQCIQGFFHSTKSTDSVTFPASAQRYHPRSLFQATLPSNINATTLQTCLCFGISHISLTCGLFKQLYSSICHLSLPSLLIRSLWWLIQCQPDLSHLPISPAQLWTAHHSPSSSSASLSYHRPLSLVLVMLDQAHSTSHLTATFELVGHTAHASNDRFQLSIEPACMHVAGYPEYLYN
jgi:hypothetical protein